VVTVVNTTHRKNCFFQKNLSSVVIILAHSVKLLGSIA